MSHPAIIVEGIGKKYKIGIDRKAAMRRTFRDALVDLASYPVRRLRTLREGTTTADEFWALKDVSFEVQPGEVVGIIGRNGAGKSTLLKILSRITEPTEGQAVIQGRVGSLLEVGTGFHAELTGRENVYLNGAILGMKKAEIDRKFDEIVAFADVEKFLDTPVKRYSSGMSVRLAFAVAAHLEPEILIVDEVLAVGDAGFQKKCLGKMGDVARQGRTVLFVSHNLAAVGALCVRGILLNAGCMVSDGRPKDVIQKYICSSANDSGSPLSERLDRSGTGETRIVSLSIKDSDNGDSIGTGSRLVVKIGYKGKEPLLRARFLVAFYDLRDVGILLLDSEAAGGLPETLPAEGVITCLTERIGITPGRCSTNVALLKGGAIVDHVSNAAYIDIEAADFYGTGRLPGREWVLCVIGHKWQLERS